LNKVIRSSSDFWDVDLNETGASRMKFRITENLLAGGNVWHASSTNEKEALNIGMSSRVLLFFISCFAAVPTPRKPGNRLSLLRKFRYLARAEMTSGL
jgi:hypothetical protein